MVENRWLKLLTKVKILQRFSLMNKLKLNFIHFQILVLKCGNLKRTQHQFLINPLRNIKSNNFILIIITSYMELIPKLIMFYVGKNHNNV